MRVTAIISGRGVITLPAKRRQALGLKAEYHLIAETNCSGGERDSVVAARLT